MNSPARFRRHRGSLAESLETTVTVRSIAELEAEIRREFPNLGEGPIDFIFKHVGHDGRCGWDTYYVIVNGTCVGMSDGVPGRRFAPWHPNVGFDMSCQAPTVNEAWRRFIRQSGASHVDQEKERYLTKTEWRVLPVTEETEKEERGQEQGA